MSQQAEKRKMDGRFNSGRIPFSERIFPRVNKTDTCWLWTGRRVVDGYGMFRFRSVSWMAHRAMWTLTFGEIPKGMLVCHKCDVRNCVNPDHLFLGTHADNMADRNAKGRQSGSIGEKHHSAKVSDAKVLEIRSLLSQGVTARELSRKFNVHANLIYNIKTRRTWRHI